MLMVIGLVGSSLLGPHHASAADTNALETCPGYRTALADARGALSRGERSAAVAALKRAKAALEKCNREEAHQPNVIVGKALAGWLRG